VFQIVLGRFDEPTHEECEICGQAADGMHIEIYSGNTFGYACINCDLALQGFSFDPEFLCSASKYIKESGIAEIL